MVDKIGVPEGYLDDMVIELDNNGKILKIIHQNETDHVTSMVGLNLFKLLPKDATIKMTKTINNAISKSEVLQDMYIIKSEKSECKYKITAIPRKNSVLVMNKCIDDGKKHNDDRRSTIDDGKYLELINFLSQLSECDDYIENILKLTCEHIELDSILIIKFNELNRYNNKVIKWTSEKGIEEYANLLSPKNIEWFVSNLKKQESIQLTKSKYLIEDEISIILDNLDVRSMLSVQMGIAKNKFLCFGQTIPNGVWTNNDIQIAKTVGMLIRQHIEHEKRMNKAIIEKENALLTLMSISDGVVVTDRFGTIKFINGETEDIIKYSIDEVVGKRAGEVVKIYCRDSNKPIANNIDKVLNTGRVVHWGKPDLLVTKHGEFKFVDSCASPIKGFNNEFLGVIMLLWDVTERVREEDKLLYASQHDAMTGLYNRRYYENALKEVDIEGNLPISIIMGDLNSLKMTNDVFGHYIGDSMIETAGRAIQNACRTKDIVSRVGGDEFVAILLNSSEKLAKKICSNIKKICRMEYEDEPYKVSISLGHATKYDMDTNLSDIIKSAEDRMYKKKLIESKNAKTEILESMKDILANRSHEDEEHIKNVEEVSVKIAKAMDMTQGQVNDLRLLAKMHDIGKISVKDCILNKTENLIDSEWEELKKHSEAGYRITQYLSEVSHIAKYVLSHHERWDGKGYPHGLKGEEIPLLCRILFVADAYDAMTSDRPYRKALELSEAVKELKLNSGTQFDPKIVDVFVNDVLINE